MVGEVLLVWRSLEEEDRPVRGAENHAGRDYGEGRFVTAEQIGELVNGWSPARERGEASVRVGLQHDGSRIARNRGVNQISCGGLPWPGLSVRRLRPATGR